MDVRLDLFNKQRKSHPHVTSLQEDRLGRADDLQVRADELTDRITRLIDVDTIIEVRSTKGHSRQEPA